MKVRIEIELDGEGAEKALCDIKERALWIHGCRDMGCYQCSHVQITDKDFVIVEDKD